MSSSDPILSLKNIRKSRDKHVVLSDVSLTVTNRELVVLSGPSGAGKTTLLRIIAGLEAPDAGKVLIDGVEASSDRRLHLDPSARSVTMVFQDLALWPNLSVLQNVLLALCGSHMSRKGRLERVRETLEQCGLAGFDRCSVAQLSGGELQRVALARALVARPKLVLLDEPFVFLDVLLKAELFEQFQKLRRNHDFGALVVVHNPADALALNADRLAILEDGVIHETVTMREFREYSPTSRTLRAWRNSFTTSRFQSYLGP